MPQNYALPPMKNNSQTSLKLKFILGLLSLLFVQFTFGQGGPNLSLGSNQIICSGSNTAIVPAIVSNLQGLTVSTYAWTVEGVNAGTTSSTSITVNASLSPNNPQDVNCVVTLSDGSTIDDNMKVYTISPGVIAGDQFSCTSPYDPSPFTSTSGGTTSLNNVNNFSHTYQWESATDINGPWTPIAGATNATYNAPNISSTTFFRRVLEVTIGNNNPVTETCISNVLTVQVLNAPTISANQCIASGGTANMSVSFNPALPAGYTASYSWTGPSSFSGSTATVTVSNFSLAKAGAYTAIVTVTGAGNSCPYSLTTNLNLIPTTPTFSIPTAGCSGTPFTPTGFTAQSGMNYQWSISPSNGNSTGLNTTTPSFLFNSSGTYDIFVTATNPNGNCPATSTSYSITLPAFGIALPYVSTNGAYWSNPTLVNGVYTYKKCSGAVSNALIENASLQLGSNPAGTTYSIQIGNSPSQPYTDSLLQNLIYGNLNVVLTANYSGCSQSIPFNIYTGSNPYVSIGTQNSVGICPVPPSNNVQFTVDPTPISGIPNSPGTTYNLTFSDTPGASPISFLDLINDTSVIHPYTYTSCGQTNLNTQFPANTFYATVTATNTCGQTQSSVSPITVNAAPVANFSVTDSTICVGQQITATNLGQSGQFISTSPPYDCTAQGKFFWTITGGVLNTNFSIISGTLGSQNTNYNNTTGNGSNTLVVQFNTPGYYTITQTYYNECALKTKVRHICVINPPSSIFTLNPNSGCSPLTVSTNNTSSAPTCNGSPVTLSYVWTITNPATNATSVISNPATQNPTLTFSNTTLTPQTFNVNLSVIPMEPAASSIPFSNSTLFCTPAISGTPVVGSITGPVNGVWSGTITGLTGVSVPNGTLMTATNGTGPNGGSLGSGATVTVVSSTATTINFNSSGGYAPIPGSITNLLRASNGTVGSISGPVNGVWTATISGLCSTTGITVGSVIYAANAVGSLGSGGIYTVTAVTSNTITYTATGGTTPIAGSVTNVALTSCVASSTQSVIVYPEVNFTNSPTTTLCSGSTLGINLATNVSSTFTWVATPNANVSGESTTTQSGSTINDQLVNLTNTPQTVTYTAVATSSVALGSCTKTQTLTVTVNPAISLTDPSDLVVCPGVTQPAIAFVTSPTSGVSINWSNNTTSIGLAGSGTGNIAAFSPVNNSNSNVTATITVTPSFGVCNGTPQTFTITVNAILPGSPKRINKFKWNRYHYFDLATKFQCNRTMDLYSWSNRIII
jgi:PKD-like domain